VSGLDLRHPDAQTGGQGVAATRSDLLAPVFQVLEVFFVVLEDELHVPQAREVREAIREPGVPVARGLHSDSPPLMRHFVRTETLFNPALIDRLERPHRQVDEAREGLTTRVRNLRGVIPGKQLWTKRVSEEGEAVDDVAGDLIPWVSLRQKQLVQTEVSFPVHLNRHRRDAR